MPGWEQLGMQAAGQGLSAGLGLLLQGQQDRRQLRQQEKLQNLQIKGDKQLTDYNFMKQMEMWRNTNYPAQMAMLKQAGLNPALMYKGGGDGGTTAISQGSVTGANAPTGGGEIQAMMAMGLTRQLQQAQIENIKASTEKTKAETTAVAPAIQKTQAETASITQGIENQKAAAELIEAQRYATNIMSDINARSSNSQVASAARRLEQETEQVKQMLRENNIGEETIKSKVMQIQMDAINAYLSGLKTEQDTEKSKAEIENMQQQIKLGQGKLALETAIADGTIINWKGNALDVIKRVIGSWISKK